MSENEKPRPFRRDAHAVQWTCQRCGYTVQEVGNPSNPPPGWGDAIRPVVVRGEHRDLPQMWSDPQYRVRMCPDCITTLKAFFAVTPKDYHLGEVVTIENLQLAERNN